MTEHPSKEDDFTELGMLATKIEALKSELKVLFQRRRIIWKRRITPKGDSEPMELARASRVKLPQIKAGIQDKFFHE